MEPQRPGWQTSEFWSTVGSQLTSLTGLLVMLNIIGEDAKESISSAVVAVAIAVGALIQAVLPLWKFIQSRTEVKVAAAKAAASVEVAKAEVETAKVESAAMVKVAEADAKKPELSGSGFKQG